MVGPEPTSCTTARSSQSNHPSNGKPSCPIEVCPYQSHSEQGMSLFETCIHRPVFAIVMTLLLVLFGLLSFLRLPVREYPDIKPPIVSVRTIYQGASASVVELDVTTPLKDALSGIQGLRTITSASREEVSLITMEFELKRDLDGATNDVRDRVSQIRPVLPLGILEPHVEKAAAENTEVLWLTVSSDRHSELEMSDIADRFIKTRLDMIPGVSATYLDRVPTQLTDRGDCSAIDVERMAGRWVRRVCTPPLAAGSLVQNRAARCNRRDIPAAELRPSCFHHTSRQLAPSSHTQ